LLAPSKERSESVIHCTLPRFALFEDTFQGIFVIPNLQVASLRSLPGANHVQPLRGCSPKSIQVCYSEYLRDRLLVLLYLRSKGFDGIELYVVSNALDELYTEGFAIEAAVEIEDVGLEG
jgi:hypothetical protein